MQLLVRGFSKLPKHGFSRPESTKNCQLRAQSREFEKLWTSKLRLCAMTASFQAKDPFSKETIQASTKDHHFPGSTLLMKFGQVEYHSKLLLQLAVPNDTVVLPRILATAVVASCGFVFNVSAVATADDHADGLLFRCLSKAPRGCNMVVAGRRLKGSGNEHLKERAWKKINHHF